MMATDLERARTLFAEAGLPFPPIPDEFLAGFRQVADWFFATTDLETSPYFFREHVERAKRNQVPNYVLLAHDGHGANSYAIHYYVVQKPLYLFVQIGWGGVYMDADEAGAALARCFDLCARLLASVPEGVRAGRISSGDRLIVGVSDFYGSSIELASGAPERNVRTRCGRPWDAIEAAIKLVESESSPVSLDPCS